MKRKPAKNLNEEFARIRRDHQSALKRTAARVVLGPSVMRVFKKGTRDALMPILSKIDLEHLHSVTNQKIFSKWFDVHVKRIARIVKRRNRRNSRIFPGYKWGHTTKILALFVRDLVLSSRYFEDGEAQRLSYFLHVPIDGVVMKRMESMNAPLPFSQIKGIDSRKKFYDVQATLTKAAQKAGVPRIWFDDNWGIVRTDFS